MGFSFQERENNNNYYIKQRQEKRTENKNSLSDRGRRKKTSIKRFDLIVQRFCHRTAALIHHPWLIHERHTALY